MKRILTIRLYAPVLAIGAISLIAVVCAAESTNDRAFQKMKLDADEPAWNPTKISETVGYRTRTVENVRQAFVCDGCERALVRKKAVTSPTPKLLDGAAEAKFVALHLGKPPADFGHWTL